MPSLDQCQPHLRTLQNLHHPWRRPHPRPQARVLAHKRVRNPTTTVHTPDRPRAVPPSLQALSAKHQTEPRASVRNANASTPAHARWSVSSTATSRSLLWYVDPFPSLHPHPDNDERTNERPRSSSPTCPSQPYSATSPTLTSSQPSTRTRSPPRILPRPPHSRRLSAGTPRRRRVFRPQHPQTDPDATQRSPTADAAPDSSKTSSRVVRQSLPTWTKRTACSLALQSVTFWTRYGGKKSTFSPRSCAKSRVRQRVLPVSRRAPEDPFDSELRVSCVCFRIPSFNSPFEARVPGSSLGISDHH